MPIKLPIVEDSAHMRASLVRLEESIPGVYCNWTAAGPADAVRIAAMSHHASQFNRRHSVAVGTDWFFDKATEFEVLLDDFRDRAVYQ